MNTRIPSRAALSAVILACASLAQAAQSPLDSDWYRGQPAPVARQSADTKIYVDVDNPLTPTHFTGMPATRFEATAAWTSRPYVDSDNPLDASYRAR